MSTCFVKGLGFSGLLNPIDGVDASEGRILGRPTNFLGRLDHVLIRPGRIGCRFEIGRADRDQAGGSSGV